MSFTCSLRCHLLALLAVAMIPVALGHSISDLQDVQFEVIRSFEGMNTKSGRMINISTSSRNSVRVIGENDWAYIIKVHKNNVPIKGEFFVAKKWAKRALNLQAAQHAVEMNKSVSESTDVPKPDCCDPNIHDDPEEVTILEGMESSLRPKARPEDFAEKVAGQTDYLPGCQALDVENSSKPRDPKELMRCIRSIQDEVTQGARSRNGQLLRGKVFRNLYSKLNPQEQRFAAMVFTAHGEALNITTGNPPALQEMSSIMKVIENRMNKANQKGGNFNELDIILHPWWFSVYNKNSNQWRSTLDPKVNKNLRKAVSAYIEFESADFEPQPEINQVYHYHANYVRPDWATGSKELRPSVNGDLTRPAPAGYNERSASDRQKITKSYRRVRHIFYKDIAWSERPTTPWRN